MSARREKRRGRNGEENWYWIVDFVFRHADGRRERIRRYSPVNNRRGAEQYERSLREDFLKKDADEEEAIVAQTFREFWKEFDAVYIPANNKYSEAVSKRSALKNHLLPAFGDKLLSEINTEAIERYKSAQLKRSLCNSTINYQLATLRTMLRVAVEWRRLRRAPRIKLLKLPKDKKIDFLNFEEAKALVAAAKTEPVWASMIVVALNTGLRMGELLGLRWSDCDMELRQIIVSQRNWKGNIDTPKSGKGRVVPLNSRALETLRSLPREHELVWRRPLDGRGRTSNGDKRKDQRELSDGHLTVALRRIRKRAGLRHIGWHTLRHYAEHRIMPSARRRARGYLRIHPDRLGIIRAPLGRPIACQGGDIGAYGGLAWVPSWKALSL